VGGRGRAGRQRLPRAISSRGCTRSHHSRCCLQEGLLHVVFALCRPSRAVSSHSGDCCSQPRVPLPPLAAPAAAIAAAARSLLAARRCCPIIACHPAAAARGLARGRSSGPHLVASFSGLGRIAGAARNSEREGPVGHCEIARPANKASPRGDPSCTHGQRYPRPISCTRLAGPPSHIALSIAHLLTVSSLPRAPPHHTTLTMIATASKIAVVRAPRCPQAPALRL
jgi:hypothetical protein